MSDAVERPLVGLANSNLRNGPLSIRRVPRCFTSHGSRVGELNGTEGLPEDATLRHDDAGAQEANGDGFVIARPPHSRREPEARKKGKGDCWSPNGKAIRLVLFVFHSRLIPRQAGDSRNKRETRIPGEFISVENNDTMASWGEEQEERRGGRMGEGQMNEVRGGRGVF